MLWASLVTIYKLFIKLHLDYGDILYDQTCKNAFHKRLESIQYNAALAITGAIRVSSKEKNYQELGFESLHQQQWYRKVRFFFKIIRDQSCNYLSELIPTARKGYMKDINAVFFF